MTCTAKEKWKLKRIDRRHIFLNASKIRSVGVIQDYKILMLSLFSLYFVKLKSKLKVFRKFMEEMWATIFLNSNSLKESKIYWMCGHAWSPIFLNSQRMHLGVKRNPHPPLSENWSLWVPVIIITEPSYGKNATVSTVISCISYALQWYPILMIGYLKRHLL